jgi:flagellar basal-body rod protein FlgC
MSDLFSSLKISGSGMSVQRKRMNATAENIANAETTRTPEGGPYSRKRVIVSSEDVRTSFAGELNKARVNLRRTSNDHLTNTRKYSIGDLDISHASAKVHQSPRPPVKMIYDPSHPDANGEGYVAMPDINVVTEMVNMMSASRAFEANVTAVNATKGMIAEALKI